MEYKTLSFAWMWTRKSPFGTTTIYWVKSKRAFDDFFLLLSIQFYILILEVTEYVEIQMYNIHDAVILTYQWRHLNTLCVSSNTIDEPQTRDSLGNITWVR